MDGAQSQPKTAEEPSKQEQANSSSDAKPLEGQPQQDEKTGGSNPQDAMDEWVYQDPQGVVQVRGRPHLVTHQAPLQRNAA